MALKILGQAKPLSASIASIADYSGTVAGTVKATTSANHGFSTSDVIIVDGTTDYDGIHTITVVDADEFYFTETYTSSQTGTAAQLVDLYTVPSTKETVVATNSVCNTDESNFDYIYIILTQSGDAVTFNNSLIYKMKINQMWAGRFTDGICLAESDKISVCSLYGYSSFAAWGEEI